MSWMIARAKFKMTETELTRRHSVRTVTHINMVWCGLVWCVWGGGVEGGREGGAGREEVYGAGSTESSAAPFPISPSAPLLPPRWRLLVSHLYFADFHAWQRAGLKRSSLLT